MRVWWLFSVVVFGGCQCSAPSGVELSGAPLEFGEVAVGAQSVKSFTVLNHTATDLPVTVAPFADPQKDPFVVNGGSLIAPAGGAVAVAVTFVPLQEVPYTSQLQLTVGSASLTAALSGSGINAGCLPLPPVEFCGVVLGQTGTSAVAIDNPTALAMTVTVGPAKGGGFSVPGESELQVEPGARAMVPVTFTPASVGSSLGTLKVQRSGCPDTSVALSGAGVRSLLQWAPGEVDFGYVPPSRTKTLSVTVTNVGPAEVSVTPMVSHGAPDYSTPAQPFTLSRCSGTFEVPVAFTPAQLGRREGTLTLASDGGQLVVGLRGTGGGPQLDVAEVLDFGAVPYFAAAPAANTVTRELLISNLGTPSSDPQGNLRFENPPFTIESLSGDGRLEADFSAYNPAVGVAATEGSNQLRVPVRFTADSASGPQEFRLTLFSNDFVRPQVVVRVLAQAVVVPPCNFTLSAAALDFGLVTSPAHLQRQLTIHNNGSLAGQRCLLTSVRLETGADSMFELGASQPQSIDLAPGDDAVVLLQARPRTPVPARPASASGALLVGISSPGTPTVRVPLTAQTGTGCLMPAPAEWDFGTVAAGCVTPVRHVRLHQRCAQPSTVVSAAVADCAGSCPFAISNRTADAFDVGFTPPATGRFDAVVQLEAQEQGVTVRYVVPITGEASASGVTEEELGNPAAADVVVAFDQMQTADQAAIAAEAPALFDWATTHATPFQLGVVAADVGHLDGGFVVHDGQPPILTPASLPNPAAAFGSKVQLGQSGSGLEGCLDPVLAAFAPPAVDGRNRGFFRDDASLGVACLTWAGDQSTTAVEVAIDRLLNLHGFNHPNRLSFSVMAPFLGSAGSCAVDAFGDTSSYSQLNAQLYGSKFDYCSTMAGGGLRSMMDSLSRTLFGVREVYSLAHAPNLVAQPLAVSVDGVAITTGWTYEPASNSIRWTPAFAPPPGNSIKAKYKPLCQ